ncbi:claudin-23 [Engraulis encrasicolus]|uniref:claudin-23 n=1 Tax=Engraulis encrasicolus TaxID=184585 RepID=UPI002FD5E66A
MQTPTSMVMGIVFAPLGLVLVFTAAITPQWREGQVQVYTGPGGSLGALGSITGIRAGGDGLLLLRSDGLWETCLQVAHSELKKCWPVSGPYERDRRVRSAQGLVLASLFMCGAGIVLASVGVRCWTDLPLRGIAAAGGLLVAMAGLLSIAALGLYTHNLLSLGNEDQLGSGVAQQKLPVVHRDVPRLTLRPAGSLYFGWVGGWVQVLGGAALMLSFKRPRLSCPTCPRRHPVDSTEIYEVTC